MSKMSYEHRPMDSPYDGRLLHELLDSRAEQFPDVDAVVMYDMELNRETITFGEYKERSMYLAESFLDLGLSRGHRVLLIGRTSVPYMVFCMALSRVGANAVLLGPGALTPDKIELLKTLDCKMIIYDSKMKESQNKQLFDGIQQLFQHNLDNGIKKQILVAMDTVAMEIDTYEGHSYGSLAQRGKVSKKSRISEMQGKVQFDDPLAALFTSGSTGVPKVVQLTHFSYVNYFGPAQKHMSSTTSQWNRCFYDRPFSWIGGYTFIQVALFAECIPIAVPSELALSESIENYATVFEIWVKEHCNICSFSVSVIHKLYTNDLYLKYKLSNVGMFIIGGQRFSLDIMKKVFTMFPSARVNMLYGLTESLRIVSYILTKDDLEDEKFKKMPLAPGVEVKIVDDKEKVVPRGKVGEVYTKNPTIFLEYIGNQAATRQVKTPTGWLRTGDLGIMHDDGMIEVLGREKEVMKRAMATIFPSEIEKVLLQHTSVVEAVVFGIPDEVLHEGICACVALKQSGANSSLENIEKISYQNSSTDGFGYKQANCTSENYPGMLDELESWCRIQWPPGPDGLSLTPNVFLAMGRIPYTTTGKVFSRDIKEKAVELLESRKLQGNKGFIFF